MNGGRAGDSDAAEPTPRSIQVRFDSGHEVLSSYWGYLANGGLVIGNDDGVEVGWRVHLDVIIASAGARYDFHGKMIRRHADGNKMVVAFEPDQPHDMLLTEAFSETDDVPARQYRRYRVDLPGKLCGLDIRVVNVSRGGLGLTYSGRSPGIVGDSVVVECQRRRFQGTIQWLNARELGLRFSSASSDDVMALVDTYIAGLR